MRFIRSNVFWLNVICKQATRERRIHCGNPANRFLWSYLGNLIKQFLSSLAKFCALSLTIKDVADKSVLPDGFMAYNLDLVTKMSVQLFVFVRILRHRNGGFDRARSIHCR